MGFLFGRKKPVPAPAPVSTPTPAPISHEQSETKAYLLSVITRNFPSCSVATDFSAHLLYEAAQGIKCFPISILVMKNGKPMLAVLIVYKNSYDRKDVQNTMLACKEAGVAVQRYFYEFENAESYVVKRMAEVLRA